MGLLAAIGIHILTRLIFNRSSLSLLSIAAFFGWRILKKKSLSNDLYAVAKNYPKNDVFKNKPDLAVTSTSSSSKYLEDVKDDKTEYKDEFSYLPSTTEENFKKFKFREIRRPYNGRNRRIDSSKII